MKYFKRSVSALLVGAMAFSFVSKYNLKQNYKKIVSYNRYTNSEDLDVYNKFLNEYVAQINSLELNDIEIIIKVMSDIWSEVKGYGVPKETVIGLYNLSFIREGVGVCTSFADEFTNRMNKINWEYNARNVILKNMNNDVKIDRIDVDRVIIESDDEKSNNLDNYTKHMVTAIDLPDKDVTLIVDTTNLMLGILKNGKVYMFNCNEYLFNYDIEDNYTYTNEKLFEVLSTYLKSFFCSTNDIMSLGNQFGIESQKETYDFVEDLPTNEKKLMKILY